MELVEALQASHSLASTAGECIVAGREVDCELITSSRQGFYGHPGVLLLNITIHDVNDINLIFLSKMLNCPAVPYVQQHLEPTSVCHTHPLTEEDQLNLFVTQLVSYLNRVSPASCLKEQTLSSGWKKYIGIAATT